MIDFEEGDGHISSSDGFHEQGQHFLRRDGRAVVPVGAHYVPTSGPDWPWRVGADEFDRAFAAMAAAGLDSVRIDLLWAALEPSPGELDEDHLLTLDAILDAAERHGLTLHPTLFVGGEVGDAYWDLPWASGVNPHSDPELRRLQCMHAAALARRWQDRAAIIAWDLTDEPPFWIHHATTTDADAQVWTSELCSAIRTADPAHLITIGTASQEIDHGPFRADVVAAELDFCCVHPYPIYSPELYPDALLSSRMTHAAAFETALARGAGKSVMVHEYGASSTQFDPDRIASYDRLLAWSSFGRGAIGFYAWCWTDAEPSAYERAPYVRMPHETQFGVTTSDGELRPRGRVLSELAQAMKTIDLDGLAGLGPTSDAAIMVPHEYVHPYDQEAYGLSTAPSGPYAPAEKAWHPDRDVKPLVRAWLNAFILAARATLSVEFPRERLDGSWPATSLLLVPAPLTTTTSSLLHLRTSTWASAAAFHQAGGTLYLSCSTESAIPEMADFAGVRIIDRARVAADVVFRFVARFGDLGPGDEIRLAAPSADPHLRGVALQVVDAQVLAVDDDGSPVLTLARRGNGSTVTCAHPIELILAGLPDAHGPGEATWRIYSALAALAGIDQSAAALHPDVTSGQLTGPDGGVLVVTNHSGRPVVSSLRLPADRTDLRALPVPGSVLSNDGRELALEPYAAAVLVWRWVVRQESGRQEREAD